MATETLLSVLAEIGIEVTPKRVKKSKPASYKTEDLVKFKDYWRGPETLKLRKYWFESDRDMENMIQDNVEASVAESVCDSNNNSDCLIQTHELLSNNQMQPILEEKTSEDTLEHSSSELNYRNKRKKSESSSSGRGSDDLSSISSSCSSLLDIMDLDIELPNFPIKPLSLMAEIKYPEKQTKIMNEEEVKFESLLQQIPCQSTKLHERDDLKIKYDGRNILNMERHLSTHISPWDLIAESNVMRNPKSKNYTYADMWNPCQYESEGNEAWTTG